jgi:hypothetical protein
MDQKLFGSIDRFHSNLCDPGTDGFAIRPRAQINSSPWSLVLGALAAGNGTSFAQSPIGEHLCSGSLQERNRFVAGGMGKEGRVSNAISVGLRRRACREGKDQGPVDRRPRSRGVVVAAETEMDAMAHLQSAGYRFEVYDDMTYPDDSTLPALVAKLMRRVR